MRMIILVSEAQVMSSINILS